MEFRSCPLRKKENHKENCQGASILSSMSAFQAPDGQLSLPAGERSATPPAPRKGVPPPGVSAARGGDSSPQTAGWTGVQRGPMPTGSLSPTLPGTSPQASLGPPPLTTGPGPAQSTAEAAAAEPRLCGQSRGEDAHSAPLVWRLDLTVAAGRRGRAPGSGGHLGGPAEHVLARGLVPTPGTPWRLHQGLAPPPAQPENPSDDRKESGPLRQERW